MPRPASGANLNIADLRRILNERTRMLGRLQTRRQKAERALAAIDSEIAKLAGNGGMDGRSFSESKISTARA